MEKRAFAGDPPAGELWTKSSLMHGENVIVATKQGENVKFFSLGEDGILKAVSGRENATLFTLQTTTFEKDSLKEQNEFMIVAKPSERNKNYGTLHFSIEKNQFSVFGNNAAPRGSIPVRFVPSLVDKDRIVRKFSKSAPGSPFLGDEGKEVVSGDFFLLRIPALESSDKYVMLQCKNGENCRVSSLERNPLVDKLQDAQNALLYARKTNNKVGIAENERLVEQARDQLAKFDEGDAIKQSNDAWQFSFQSLGGIVYNRNRNRNNTVNESDNSNTNRTPKTIDSGASSTKQPTIPDNASKPLESNEVFIRKDSETWWFWIIVSAAVLIAIVVISFAVYFIYKNVRIVTPSTIA